MPPEFFVNDQKSLLVKRGFKFTPLDLKETEAKERFVDFRESYHYETSMVTRYLMYFKQVSNLFDLEFFVNKLPSRAHSAAAMETSVLSGLPFWEEGEDALFNDDDPYNDNDENNPQYSLADDGAEGPYRNQLAEQVTQRIALDKKHKNQLINELDSMKDCFDALGKRMKA